MKNLTDFFVEVDKLKRIYRYSTRKFSSRDSTADHSWKLALMAISVADELKLDINVFHSVKLALCHDIPEYITGEFDSRGDVNKEEKYSLEKKALDEIRERFGKIGIEIYNSCDEYNQGKTKEARYIKALDKIEATSHLISTGDFDDLDYTAVYADEAVSNFSELIPFLREVKRLLKEESTKAGYIWKQEYNQI